MADRAERGFMKRSVWVEPRTRPHTYSIRWFDPITGDKMREKAESDAELKFKRRAIEDRLEAYVPGKGDPKSIPLVVMEQYLTDLLMGPFGGKPRRTTTVGMKRENLTPFLETIFSMEKFTTATINNYVVKMRTPTEKYPHGLAIATIAIRLRDIRAFCNWAYRKGILGINVWKDISITESKDTGRRLTREELQRLFSNMSTDLRDFIGLAIEVGPRRGELLQCEFSDIDFERSYWLIKGVEGKSKSNHDRIIPLSRRAIETIKVRKAQGHKFVFEGFTLRKLYTHLKKALIAAEINGRVRPHDMRHTWASIFPGDRESLKRLAGWKSDTMINRYKHTEVEELRKDSEKMSEVLGNYLGNNA